MSQMTTAEKQAFLAGVHIGVLAIPRDGAAPLTAPLWYDYIPGGELRFLIGSNSQKSKLLRTGLPVSLCVQNEAPPYAYVTVSGPVVKISQSLLEEELRPIARRYLGVKAGDAYTDREGVENTVTVSVRLDQWLSVDYSKAG